MKMKVVALLLVACMLAGMMPTMAAAAVTEVSLVEALKALDATYDDTNTPTLTLTKECTLTAENTKYFVDPATDPEDIALKIMLSDYSLNITGSGSYIFLNEDAQLNIIGSNNNTVDSEIRGGYRTTLTVSDVTITKLIDNSSRTKKPQESRILGVFLHFQGL